MTKELATKQATKSEPVPFEVALGPVKYSAYRALLIKGKGKELNGSGQELEQLRSCIQEIVDFVEDHYVESAVDSETGAIHWFGIEENLQLRAPGKGGGLETVLCYVPHSAGLPPLPKYGWISFLNHIDIMRQIYGRKNFRVSV